MLATDSKPRATLVVLALCGLVACAPGTRDSSAPRQFAPSDVTGNPVTTAGVYDPGAPPADGEFYFKALGGHRCVDFGGRAYWRLNAPVYIYSCNGSIAQHVRVKELDESHDVELRVTTLFCIGVKGGDVIAGRPLELQTCNGSPAQRFALDGDSILMGSQASGRVTREFAIEPEGKRTPNRTPLVVAPRELSDAEYFRYVAVDGSARKPTNGFLTASSEVGLDWTLQFGWGTVIEVDDRAPIVLARTPKFLREGVTLRGYRKYLYQGPEIRTCVAEAGGHALEMSAPHTRITGLRLRGQTVDENCRGPFGDDSNGIFVATNEFNDTSHSWVDRLDIGYWHGHGIDVRGGTFLPEECKTLPRCTCVDNAPFPRNAAFRAVGNFVHHNRDYGIVTGQGSFILNKGNVYYGQGAHSITADPVFKTGYMAYDNLILHETPNHDIDMHGSNTKPEGPHHQGGTSGDYFDVGWNTVLATTHKNVDDRGTPCRFTAIHDNVFRQSKSDAIESHSTIPLVFWSNDFGDTPHPMDDLAVGDFDGDGIDDVFVGTGAAWYFSSGGAAEWRFLNRMPERASSLRFGDFDGDGRTDVIAVHGAHVDISWGGLSPWQTINVVAWPISDIAVGDFDGDRIADLFLATGSEWFFAPGGRNWTPFATSSIRVPDLRFGDFTKVGRTQVLRVSASHEWQIVRQVGATWDSLGPSGISSFGALVVGDFNGDGFADLGRLQNGRWEFISPGAGIDWTQLWSHNSPIAGKPIGRFDTNGTSDVIEWDGSQFFFAPGGKGPLVRLSRQSMR